MALFLACAPLSAAAQDEPAAPVEPAPGSVVVEAGTPVPVPLEGVAERLRAELPAVPVAVGPVPGGPPGSAATVTLALTADGQIHVVYRDPAGREASRIVADTSDPQAVAAAIAMIVANLHRSQVDLALAAIGPAAPPPPPPTAPEPPVVSPTPPVAPVLVAVASHTRPARVGARTTVTRPPESRVAVWASPTADMMGGLLYGVEGGGQVRFGRYRAELAISHVFSQWLGYPEFEYTHTMAVLGVRRLVSLGDRVTLGAGVGLGFVISAITDVWSSGLEYTGRSDLDALVSGGLALDVRLVGQTVFWTTRADAVTSTATTSAYRPVAPDVLGHFSTGLRLAL